MRAFARAVFSKLKNPRQNIRFQIRFNGGPWTKLSCRDWVDLRPDERKWVQDVLVGKLKPRILDIGCGVGRHITFARDIKPDVRITGIDFEQEFRDHCRAHIPQGSFAYATFEELKNALPDTELFDVILLMGNGLGVFGSEENTRAGLSWIHQHLEPGGAVLIESMDGGDGFTSDQIEIKYKGETDAPLQWGRATSVWLSQLLCELGFSPVHVEPSKATGGCFYFCLARKTDTVEPNAGHDLPRSDCPEWLDNIRREPHKWLECFPVKSILSKSLFYPGCGYDLTPVRYLKGRIHSFVFVDCWVPRDKSDLCNLLANLPAAPELRESRMVFHRELTMNDLGLDVPGGQMLPPLREGDGDLARHGELQQNAVQHGFGHWSVWELPHDQCFSLLYLLRQEACNVLHFMYHQKEYRPWVLAIISSSYEFLTGEFSHQLKTSSLLEEIRHTGITVPQATTEIESLNKLLRDNALYLRFQSIDLSEKGEQLRQRALDLVGKERIELNRLIFEAAYPTTCPRKTVAPYNDFGGGWTDLERENGYFYRCLGDLGDKYWPDYLLTDLPAGSDRKLWNHLYKYPSEGVLRYGPVRLWKFPYDRELELEE